MKNLKKRLKNKGIILPLTLFIITIITWIFSIYLIFYKTEIEGIKGLKEYNNRFWRVENLAKLGEYEVYKGEQLINMGTYKDIIEYFEDKDKIWLKKDEVSESGYSLNWIKKNIKTEEKKVDRNSNKKIYIQLIKKKSLENKNIIFKVNLLYEYPYNETDLSKYIKREFINLGVEEE